MDEKVRIQERLKEIATEMASIIEQDDENITEEQEQANEEAYSKLEEEADLLTAEFDALQTQEEKEQRRQKAEDIRTFAKQSTRHTTPNKPGPRVGRMKVNIEDDPKRGFRNFAHFATRVFDAGNTPRADDMLMHVAAGTGMQQSISSDGGVLVPPAFSKEIWDRVMVKSNSMLSYCDVIPVDAGNESVTVPAKNETSRVDGSRQGGIQGYWKSELSQLTSSKMELREVKFTPHELYVFCFISDKLLRNAPQTASTMLEEGAADEIAFKIGDAICNGNGAGKPFGFLGHASTVSVANETGQAAATIVTENISKMLMRLHVNARQGAVWFVNPDTEAALRELKFEVGTGGVPVYLPPGGVSETPYSSLYGKPVIPIEYCATLGTVGDIALANLGWYGAAIKGMTDTAYSMHLKFDYAQTAYRVIFEIDGQPWLNSAITPFKGSTTTSPFVTLATRS